MQLRFEVTCISATGSEPPADKAKDISSLKPLKKTTLGKEMSRNSKLKPAVAVSEASLSSLEPIKDARPRENNPNY
jgi:hypothetical protein